MTLDELLALDFDDLKALGKEVGVSLGGNKSQIAQRVFDKLEVDNVQDQKPEQNVDLKSDGTLPDNTPVINVNEPETVEEVQAQVQVVDSKQYFVKPKNSAPLNILHYGVPAEGLVVNADSPLLKFDYYLEISEAE